MNHLPGKLDEAKIWPPVYLTCIGLPMIRESDGLSREIVKMWFTPHYPRSDKGLSEV